MSEHERTLPIVLLNRGNFEYPNKVQGVVLRNADIQGFYVCQVLGEKQTIILHYHNITFPAVQETATVIVDETEDTNVAT